MRLDKHSEHLSLILNMNIATKNWFVKEFNTSSLTNMVSFLFAVWRENPCHNFF